MRASCYLRLWGSPTSAALKLFPPRDVSSSGLVSTVAPKALLFPEPHNVFRKAWDFPSAPNCRFFHVCTPTMPLRVRPRGCYPCAVAQCGSATQRVLHQQLHVSMRGVTKPCASDPGGKPKSQSWSKNLKAFGFPTFSFPAFGGIWSFWLGKLTFPSQAAFGEGHLQIQSQSIALPKHQPRHEVAPSL